MGLYAGIILGIYAVNSESGPAVPAGQQAPAHSLNLNLPKSSELLAQMDDVRLHAPMRHNSPLTPALIPVISRDRGVDGAQLGLLLSF